MKANKSQYKQGLPQQILRTPAFVLCAASEDDTVEENGRNAGLDEVWTSEGVRGVYTQLEVNRHNVHLVEGPRTGWTFAHPVANTVIDALLAEEVTAGLQSRTLEVVATYRTEGKGL